MNPFCLSLVNEFVLYRSIKLDDSFFNLILELSYAQRFIINSSSFRNEMSLYLVS